MRRNIVFLFIALLLIPFNQSCQHKSTQATSEVKSEDSETKKSILKLSSELGIPTDDAVIILLPPTNCASCIQLASESLTTNPHAFILHSNNNACPAKTETQTCIIYDYQNLAQLKLTRLYPIFYRLEKGIVVEMIKL